MSRYHWHDRAKDAYDEGKDDERHRQSDYGHDKYSGNETDKAYFEGREDYRREQQERRDEERREEERQQHEDYLKHQVVIQQQLDEEDYRQQED